MRVEDALADPRQRGLGRLNLLDHVDAVAVVFEHLDDAVDVPGHALEAVNRVEARLLVHLRPFPASPAPQGEGVMRRS